MVELTWQGKYETDGKRTAPLRVQLPFQTVETVNESGRERHKAPVGGQPAAPRFSVAGTIRGGGSGAVGGA